MGHYIRISRPYLILITIFISVRFVLELFGVGERLTNEISVTRLLLVLPVFVAFRFFQESLGGWKDLVMVNMVYVVWTVALLSLLSAVDKTMGLGTHYGGGAPLYYRLVWGRLFEWHAWNRLMQARGGFCPSLLIMSVLVNGIGLTSFKIKSLLKADGR